MLRVLLLFGLITASRSEPLLTSITSKFNKMTLVYPSGMQSERDLFVCSENAACNIIHRRYWLPFLVERLCRCPQRRECKSTWNEEPDNYTTMLNNRSQIKFCSELNKLSNCTIKKNAIQVVIRSHDKKPTESMDFKIKANQKGIKETNHKNVTALCQCKEPHYWKQRSNSTAFDEQSNSVTKFYVCSKLKKCISREFCGFIRKDTHSTYYRCSCPDGHICISKDKTIFKIEEMLFNGNGYKAFCLPINHSTLS